MSKIAIITDTDCSLPDAISSRYGILQVPITVHFGDETYYTGVDIDDAKVFARIDRDNKLPTTAAPSPGAFVKAYQQAFDTGAEQILCFTVSSKVSATYASALSAVDEFPGKAISVVDTLSLTLGQGFIVIAAAEAALAGASKDEILALADDVRQRTFLYASLSTLKYLAMGGRVSNLQAGFADLLSVKPILTIKDGKLEMLEKVRTQSKAWERTIDLLVTKAGERKIERLAVLHVCALEAAEKFADKLRARLACPEEILFAELSAGLSVHSGAGMVGAAVVLK